MLTSQKTAWLAAVRDEADALIVDWSLTRLSVLSHSIEQAIARLTEGVAQTAIVRDEYERLRDQLDRVDGTRLAALMARVDELAEARTCAAFALGVAVGERRGDRHE